MNNLGKVFSFNVNQMIKRKVNKVTFFLLMAVAFLSIPISAIFMGDGIAGEQIGIETQSMVISDFVEMKNSGNRYAVQYGYAIVLLFMSIFSGTYIVRSIVEEKTNHLVETLLVSIKSKDMIFGKLLAVMAFMFGQLFLIFIALAASYSLTSVFTDTSYLGDFIKKLGISLDAIELGYELPLVVITSLFLAYFLFSMISALSGAGCSASEDVESANTSGMMTVLMGYMGAVILSSMDGALLFTSLVPPLSTFAAPINFILGEIGWETLFISWGIQILCIGILYYISIVVYDSLVLYRGKRLSLGQIVKLALKKGGR